MDDTDYITGPAKVLAELQSLRSEVAELREALAVFGEIGARIHPTKDSSLILAYLPSWDIDVITNCNVVDVEEIESVSAKEVRDIGLPQRQLLSSACKLFNIDGALFTSFRCARQNLKVPFAIMSRSRAQTRDGSLTS